jgi:hypothetical protein
MRNGWSKVVFWLFDFNLSAMAVMGPFLCVIALIDWGGYLPESTSLKMFGRRVESDADYRAFLGTFGAIGGVGLIYAWLRISRRLRYFDKDVSERRRG